MAMRGEIATHPVISKDEMYRINTSGKHYINALQNRQSIKLVHEMSSLNEQHLVIAAADVISLLLLFFMQLIYGCLHFKLLYV